MLCVFPFARFTEKVADRMKVVFDFVKRPFASIFLQAHNRNGYLAFHGFQF